MSLINQMLRDLQQQKDGDGSTKPQIFRPSKMAHVPYLPLSLVLGGAALVMLFFIWWLAGALSDIMFGFESAEKTVKSQQLVVTAESQTTENDTVVVKAQEQLIMTERDVEPSSAPGINVPMVEKSPAPVNVSAVQTAPVAKVPVKKLAVKKLAVKKLAVKKQAVKNPAIKKPTVAKTIPAVVKSSTPTVRSKSVADSPRVAKKTQPIKSRPTQTPRKVVAKVPKRLHPDALPGAILSSSHSLTAITTKGPRPRLARATTPYGMAEKAFIDGKWALQQQRDNLAVSSLQHALELYPGHLSARELLAEILDKGGKAGEAMFLLAEGLEIAPDYIVFKKSYATLLVDQGDYEAAIKVMLQEGLPTVEDDPEAHVILATLYQRLGEPFLAAQTYRNLLVAWPQTGAFWVGLGGALEGQNLFEEAVECYQKALKTKNLRKDLSRYAKNRLGFLN